MTFGRRTFGRKQVVAAPPPVPQHPGPDDDGISRIIPKAVWDGPQGDFLRKLGRSPDDPGNMLPTQDLVQARHDAAFAEQTRFVERINGQLPAGTTVAPYAMVPWSIWHGRFGQMLMVCAEFYPAQPWNTMLLAEDERSSFVLDLPKHPGAYPPQLQPAMEKHLAEFETALNEAREYTDRSMASGEMDVKVFGDALHVLKRDVIAMANTFASITFGEEVYDKHLEMFGPTLGWPHAEGLLANRGR